MCQSVYPEFAEEGAILRHMCIRMRFFHLRDFMAVRILHSSRSLASLCDVTDNTCTIANWNSIRSLPICECCAVFTIVVWKLVSPVLSRLFRDVYTGVDVRQKKAMPVKELHTLLYKTPQLSTCGVLRRLPDWCSSSAECLLRILRIWKSRHWHKGYWDITVSRQALL